MDATSDDTPRAARDDDAPDAPGDDAPAELGRELLRVETAADVRAARELRRYRDRQRLRRPPKRFDLVWIGIPVAIGLVGLLVTGPDPLWLIALAIGGIYGLGEWRERRLDHRAAAATAESPRRVLAFHEQGIVVTIGEAEHRMGWRGLDEVRRLEGAYLVRFHDGVDPIYVPYEALGSDGRSGRLESLLASRDRLVQDG